MSICIGRHRIGALAAAAVLAACGGGGGSNTVALKSKADVAREIANVYGLYDDSSPSAFVAANSVSAKFMARAAATHASRQSGPVAKAETVGCDSGSYTYDSFVNVSRPMPLFNAAPAVDYSYTDYNDCRSEEGMTVYVTDGYEEFGHNGAYTDTSVQNPNYGYHLWGSGNSALVSTVEDTSANAGAGKGTLRARGRFEFRDNGEAAESREIVDFSLKVRAGDINEDIALGAGETGNPLVIVNNYVAGTAAIDGPFFYRYVEACRGGRLDYDTVQPLVFMSDDSGTYVAGGELAITSGSVTVTLTFQPDGDVSYELSTGDTGEITRAELAGTNACGVFI